MSIFQGVGAAFVTYVLLHLCFTPETFLWGYDEANSTNLGRMTARNLLGHRLRWIFKWIHCKNPIMTHRIPGIFTSIWLIFMVNLGKKIYHHPRILIMGETSRNFTVTCDFGTGWFCCNSPFSITKWHRKSKR